MAYDDDFKWAVRETAKKFGPPPAIGSFEPITGDIGRNEKDEYLQWTGNSWVPAPTALCTLIRETLDSL